MLQDGPYRQIIRIETIFKPWCEHCFLSISHRQVPSCALIPWPQLHPSIQFAITIKVHRYRRGGGIVASSRLTLDRLEWILAGLPHVVPTIRFPGIVPGKPIRSLMALKAGLTRPS